MEQDLLIIEFDYSRLVWQVQSDTFYRRGHNSPVRLCTMPQIHDPKPTPC